MERWELLCVLGGNYPDKAAVANRMAVPPKLHIELLCSPGVPLLGTRLRELKAETQTDLSHSRSQQHYSE